MTFDDFYWSKIDIKNSDTNLAERFGHEVWIYQQERIDILQKRINELEIYILDNKKHIPMSEWHGYTDEEYVDADDLLDLLRGVNEK